MSDLEIKYTGVVYCAKKIYRKYGISGFYTGASMLVASTLVYRFTFFKLVEALKWMAKSNTELFYLSQAIVLISGIVVYPFMTIRNRMIVDNTNAF